MKMTMRWFGESDRVRLQDIAQIPIMRGIVGTFEGKSDTVVWSEADFRGLRQQVEDVGLTLDVIESIPVAESIKKGTADRDSLIDIFCQSVRNMGRAGIPVLCYNFMPVFDWMRTNLQVHFADASFGTAYEHQAMLDYDLSKGLEARVAWARGYSGDEIRVILDEYKAIDEDALFENFSYFLRRVIPVAEEADVKLALHPDDPPWSIFGLPRIVRDAATIERILSIVDSPNNGLTFCTGSLGSAAGNKLPAMIHQFADRINFVHLRNVELTGDKSFVEVAHSSPRGNVDVPAIIQALIDIGYTGPIRPDHGRMIWGETGRIGYGLYDRALAAMYLHGVWQGLRYADGKES
ncbi:MAG: mannonate dehydratase [Anaerolineaceae bacterium]|nr:mannonate dehydratase [Anaerolineaceae bacterium]